MAFTGSEIAFRAVRPTPFGNTGCLRKIIDPASAPAAILTNEVAAAYVA